MMKNKIILFILFILSDFLSCTKPYIVLLVFDTLVNDTAIIGKLGKTEKLSITKRIIV